MAARTNLATIRSELDQLATGGEGIVYSVRSKPDVVYKEYKINVRPTLNTLALEGLVDLGATIKADDWMRISSRTSWPHTLVIDGTQPTGFLMNRIEKRFYKNYGLKKNPRKVLCEWNHIVYQAEPLSAGMTTEIPQLDTRQKLALVNDLAHTIAVLHRHNVIVGDISGRNLLWTLEPEPQVLIIDCDSFRIDGKPGTSPSKQSPYWTDELAIGRDTDQSSDCHKIAIAAYRAILNDPSKPPNPDRILNTYRDDIPQDVRNLIAAGLQSANRPSATDWTECFDRLNRFGGRIVLSTDPTQRQPAQPRNATPKPRQPRPRLELN